jgi:hypothetical protein
MFKQLTAGFTFANIHHGSYYPLLYFKKGSTAACVAPNHAMETMQNMKTCMKH